VVEWSITTDCKSVAHWAPKVRILPDAQNKEPDSLEFGDFIFRSRGDTLCVDSFSLLKMTNFPVMHLGVFSGLILDRRKDGWTLLEDTHASDNQTINLHKPFMGDEVEINGGVILERVKGRNLAGQQHAERLLAQHMRLPEEWRGKLILFLGTSWEAFSGSRLVPCLVFRGGWWYLDWHTLYANWRSNTLVAIYN
jgi:hypothetical protein